MALHIGQYGDVPKKVALGRPQDVIFQRPKDVGIGPPQDVGGNVPWHHIEDHMETSIGRLLGRPQDLHGTQFYRVGRSY